MFEETTTRFWIEGDRMTEETNSQQYDEEQCCRCCCCCCCDGGGGDDGEADDEGDGGPSTNFVLLVLGIAGMGLVLALNSNPGAGYLFFLAAAALVFF